MNTNLVPSPVFRQLSVLLDTPDLADLGPQRRPGTLSLDELQRRIDQMLDNTALPAHAQELIRGTLLLWHDHLDAAHSIAQEVEDADGSLLHAIMHRREPDYSNSKYWFRRAGKHPCYLVIAGRISALLGPERKGLMSRLTRGGDWDPFAFVDHCQEAAQSGSKYAGKESLQEIQRIEFDSFLEYLCL